MIELGKMCVFMGSPDVPVDRGTYCLVIKKHRSLKYWRVLMEETLYWIHEEELRLP